jgi:hypothetical protein
MNHECGDDCDICRYQAMSLFMPQFEWLECDGVIDITRHNSPQEECRCKHCLKRAEDRIEG